MKDDKQKIADFMNFNGKLFDFWNNLNFEYERDELRDIVKPVRNFLKELGDPQEFVDAAKECFEVLKNLPWELDAADVAKIENAITRFDKALGKV